MNKKGSAIVRTPTESRREAEKFLWHLRPPWRDKFEHDHWWKRTASTPKPEAVVWEMLRRHPRAGTLLAEQLAEPGYYYNSTKIEDFISTRGTLSWPMLQEDDQLFWFNGLNELPPQHGVCLPNRPGLFQVVNILGGTLEIRSLAQMRSFLKQFWAYIDGKETGSSSDGLRNAQKIWNDLAASDGAFGKGPNWEAFLCLSSGGVLIGFDPNFPGVEKLVQAEVKKFLEEHRKSSGTPVTKGRLYWPEWFEVIAKFEKMELSRKKNTIRDDRLFARYRRFIRQWKWPS